MTDPGPKRVCRPELIGGTWPQVMGPVILWPACPHCRQYVCQCTAPPIPTIGGDASPV